MTDKDRLNVLIHNRDAYYDDRGFASHLCLFKLGDVIEALVALDNGYDMLKYFIKNLITVDGNDIRINKAMKAFYDARPDLVNEILRSILQEALDSDDRYTSGYVICFIDYFSTCVNLYNIIVDVMTCEVLGNEIFKIVIDIGYSYIDDMPEYVRLTKYLVAAISLDDEEKLITIVRVMTVNIDMDLFFVHVLHEIIHNHRTVYFVIIDVLGYMINTQTITDIIYTGFIGENYEYNSKMFELFENVKARILQL